MRGIYFKEINAFLSSLSGYVVILAFLLASGLLLWVMPDTPIFPFGNILDYGYASLEQFFVMAPLLLLFLIPAITMRSFSEEYSKGTIEWLVTQPLNLLQIIGGKFLAAFTLVIIALLPTLIYLFSIVWLSMNNAPLDAGAIASAYLGLILLSACFTAIGLFSSSLTDNQIVSFLLSLFLCFIFYSGFEAFSRISAFRGGADYYLQMIGMDYHYNSICRGLIDTRDLIYFLSFTAFFVVLTLESLKNKIQKN